VNLAELLTIPASMFPEQEILRFEGQGTSYGVLAERVMFTTGALRGLGVQPGDRVAMLETNTPAVVEALYATTSLGAVFVPLNYRARADELAHMVGVAAPRVLLVGERYVEVARAAVAEARVLGDDGPHPNALPGGEGTAALPAREAKRAPYGGAGYWRPMARKTSCQRSVSLSIWATVRPCSGIHSLNGTCWVAVW
jgi:acyl-CoA synthetase (AMP-forming)/AMP-acid ligase II